MTKMPSPLRSNPVLNFVRYLTMVDFNAKKLLCWTVTAFVLTALATGCEAGVEEEEELEEEGLVPRIERFVAIQPTRLRT